MKKILIGLVIFIVLIVVSGYFLAKGAFFQYYLGIKLEEKGDFIQAIKKYEHVEKTFPKYKRIPEIIYRIGSIFQNEILNYPLAREAYTRLIQNYK